MKVVANVVFYFIIIEFAMATPEICDPCQSRNITKTSVSWCMECEEELCTVLGNQKIVEIVWHPLTPNPERWY
jgi:hypothetical protein